MEKERKRAQWGWYLYDFGNSAYAAVVLLAIYSAYFKGSVVGGAEGSRLWGIAVGIAMLVSAVISPLLASRALSTPMAISPDCFAMATNTPQEFPSKPFSLES